MIVCVLRIESRQANERNGGGDCESVLGVEESLFFCFFVFFGSSKKLKVVCGTERNALFGWGLGARQRQRQRQRQQQHIKFFVREFSHQGGACCVVIGGPEAQARGCTHTGHGAFWARDTRHRMPFIFIFFVNDSCATSALSCHLVSLTFCFGVIWLEELPVTVCLVPLA